MNKRIKRCFISLDFRGFVLGWINEFRISLMIERVIVGHRFEPRALTFKASKGTYGIKFLRPLIRFNA